MKQENTTIKSLLNQIYNEPDLGEEVFEFIHPHITNAYSLIEADDYNKQLNQPRIFKNEEDIENLRNIVYRDFPNIFNIYTALPLKYRTTNKLKTGETHREILLNNMVKLVNNMINIESVQYEEMDTNAIVQTKILNKKYSKYEHNNLEKVVDGTEKEFEIQSQVQFSNEFNYENFKKSITPEELALKENNRQFKAGKNIHIDFKNGTIEQKISFKEKMKKWTQEVVQISHSFIKSEKTKKGIRILLLPIVYPLYKINKLRRFIYYNGLTVPTIFLTVLAIMFINFGFFTR